MGDANSSLVDTRIARTEAPAAAKQLYRRLLHDGVILPQLRNDIPHCLGRAFPVRDDHSGFAALFGWNVDHRPLPHERITGIKIEVTDWYWYTEPNEEPQLLPAPPAERHYGLFLNYDGGFNVNCPHCARAIERGDNEGSPLDVALKQWCLDPEHTFLHCNACSLDSALPDWRSDAHGFAAGHLGMTLWGGHLLALTERPDYASAQVLWRLFGGTAMAPAPAIVYCTI